MNPLEKSAPSIFVVCSPYQVICAVEAINHFEIHDCLFFVVFHKGDKRNAHLTKCLNYFKIDYVEISGEYHKWKHRYNVLKAYIPKWNKYKRAFVGDFRFGDLLFYSSLYLSNDSNVIFLDDGAASIVEFNKQSKRIKNSLEERVDHICRLRKIRYGKYYFSQFTDAHNKDLVIIKNEMSFFKQINKEKGSQESVYFIGTNPSRYITNYFDMSVQDYFKRLDVIFQVIKKKYSGDSIIYVAHPRDDETYTKILCQQYNIMYMKSDIAIEIDLLMSDTIPKCVYGFNSTALCNLKMYYPQLPVVSCLLSSKYAESLSVYNDYITKLGVCVEKFQ